MRVGGGAAARPRDGGGTACDGGMLLLDSNTARQPLERLGVFRCRHATIRFTSGIWSPQSRHTSGVQAICCSQVPRYSSANAAVPAVNKRPGMKPSMMRCARMYNPSRSSIEPRLANERLANEFGAGRFCETTKCEAASAIDEFPHRRRQSATDRRGQSSPAVNRPHALLRPSPV